MADIYAFLELEGIPGEAQDSAYKDKIELQSFAWGASNNSSYTSGNPNAPQGNQVAFIQITGSASQSVTLAAGTYSISLEAAQRAVGPSNQTIEILVDDALVGTITPSGTRPCRSSPPPRRTGRPASPR